MIIFFILLKGMYEARNIRMYVYMCGKGVSILSLFLWFGNVLRVW